MKKALKQSMRSNKSIFSAGISLIFIFISVLLITVGYSSLNTELNISGEAVVRVDADIRITNCVLDGVTNGGLEDYACIFSKDAINNGVTLPNLNSTVTYNISVTNFVDVLMALDSISSLNFNNSDMEYILSNISLGDPILGITSVDFQLTYKYKDAVLVLPANTSLGSQLELNFIVQAFTLTVDAASGTWSGTTPQTLSTDATTTIAAPTRSGYVFTGWTLVGTGSTLVGTTFTMGSSNATLTANWLAYVSMYTYTGSSTVIDDGSGNWRIKFLTSGTFTPLANITIDLFLVGGGAGGYPGYNNSNYGGGGGGGGRTATVSSVALNASQAYTITIGGGGGQNAAGGWTYFAAYSINGGNPPVTSGRYGGNGGSGGATGTSSYTPGGSGGSNGGNGWAASGLIAGVGQGTTTREFGDPAGTLYAGGGGAGGSGYNSGGAGGPGGAGGGGAGGPYRGQPGVAGTANTGGGGGGGAGYSTSASAGAGGAGGSGIVVIRNHR